MRDALRRERGGHVHGLVNLAVSDASLLVLSPDTDGAYAPIAGQVRRARLERRPIVTFVALPVGGLDLG